jgi:subtilisin family serine protease
MSVILLRLRIIALLALGMIASSLRAEEPSSGAWLGVDAWHAKGLTGRDITVAVLDSGFRGFRGHLGKALPKQVRARSFRIDGNLEAKDSPHGLLCAEIVHTLAPDAELLFANWEPDCPEAFLKAVAWCRAQGATVFTCSIIMPGWSDGHGGGDVHPELEKLVGDALFFASAGNLAQRHWHGTFQDDGQRFHRWKAERTENTIRPWGGQSVSVEVTGPAGSRYRLAVLDDRGRSVGEEQTLAARGVHGSAIRFLPETGLAYRARVELIDGTGGDFRFIVLGGDLEIATADGCLVFPGDGKKILTVGAVTAAGDRLACSSSGVQATPIKPDCVAPVPYPSRIRETPFSGTSAATPQAAALAALLWSREPKANAATIGDMLRKNCVDLGPPGPDVDTGFGRVRLPRP